MTAEEKRAYDKRYQEAHRTEISARRAILKGATVEKIDRGQVYLRDNGICGICNLPVPLHEVTLDHIIPLARGGEHSYRNIQLAHRSCNSSKGSKLQSNGGKP
jgi:5-methylcytosine-specific restriction endonuclease McrA